MRRLARIVMGPILRRSPAKSMSPTSLFHGMVLEPALEHYGIPGASQALRHRERFVVMSSISEFHSLKTVAFGLFAGFVTVSTIGLSTRPAEAVVYCRAVGVPKGCVVRPAAPAARAAIYCTSPGLPVGCVARPGVRAVTPGVGAPGVGVRPGVGVNANGGVNRIGVR